MSVYSEYEAFFPNLPGYRSNSTTAGSKRSLLKKVDGDSVIVDETLPDIARRQDSMDIRTQSSTSLVSNTSSLKPRPKFRIDPNLADVVLSFHAFFEEDIMYSTSQSEQRRIRICNINYFAESGLISVIEKQQLNSGIPQGIIVKKDIIYKSDDSPVTVEDLVPGNSVEIYGRYYHIVGCSDHTKQFLKDAYGIDDIPHYSIPYDSFNTSLITTNNLKEDDWTRFRSRKSHSKDFVEAQLGNYVDNSGREGFVRYGNQKLQFRCVWDNSAILYGDITEYCLVYHLSDDTIEIFAVNAPNSGRDMFRRLLKRSKLPRNVNVSSASNIGNNKIDNYFKWTDLSIGMELNVYARLLRIVDADEFTREYYHSRGQPLREISSQSQMQSSVVVTRKREVPPPTGFGSDEDSLRSCFGPLQIQPPHFKKQGENKVLSFAATMCSGSPENYSRKFILMYYVQDSTLKIIEPPVRNSGFVGGTFLSRRSHKVDNGDQLNESYLYVGAKIKVMNNIFLLQRTNESTLRWMEEKGLPKANIKLVATKLRRCLQLDALNGVLAERFKSFCNLNHGFTFDELRAVLNDYGLLADPANYGVNEELQSKLVDHEVLTIFRAEGNRANTMDFKVLHELIVSESDSDN